MTTHTLLAVTHEGETHIEKRFRSSVEATLKREFELAKNALQGRTAQAIYSADGTLPYSWCPAECEMFGKVGAV